MRDNNSSWRKLQYKLGQIQQLEKECIFILIEHPTCCESKEEKEEMISLAINHLERKLKKTTTTNSTACNAMSIYLSIALDEFEDASEEHSKKQAAKKVTMKLLEFTEADLKRIPEDFKERAREIANQYLIKL